VVRLVLTQTSSLVFAGILAGLGCAAALTRYLEAMLFGLTPLDPGTFVAVPVIFILVAGAACYMPVRRALNVDPIAALRSE
jgi:ABC-type antimicrobial peptide transport system permease subunit